MREWVERHTSVSELQAALAAERQARQAAEAQTAMLVQEVNEYHRFAKLPELTPDDYPGAEKLLRLVQAAMKYLEYREQQGVHEAWPHRTPEADLLWVTFELRADAPVDAPTPPPSGRLWAAS